MAVSVSQSLTYDNSSKDASNNTISVRYIVKCTTSGDSWNGNKQTGTFYIDGNKYTKSYTLPKNKTTTVFDKTVTVNNASDRKISASYSFPTTPYYGTKTGKTSTTLPNIPRYAKSYHSLNKKTINSIIMNWSSDSTIDYIWYSINNGSNWTGINVSDGTNGTYEITGLNPNTTYQIKTRVRRKDSQLTTDSSTLAVTTHDIARLTKYSDFNLGDEVSIQYSNPSGEKIEAGIYSVDGKTEYAAYRKVSGTSYILKLTDNELDALYRAMKINNSINVKIYLNTANNAYRDSKEVIVTLRGNQKTGYIKKTSIWKRSKKWINVNGTWKRCVRWIKVNGDWKRCI